MLYPTYLRRSDPFALMRSMMRDIDRGFWPAAGAATVAAPSSSRAASRFITTPIVP